MSIETQTPLLEAKAGRTLEGIGQETYIYLNSAIKSTLLESDVSGDKSDDLHYYDEAQGLDVLVHGDSPSGTSPAVIIDNLNPNQEDVSNRIAIREDGAMIVDGSTVFDIDQAEGIAQFSHFITTLPRK